MTSCHRPVAGVMLKPLSKQYNPFNTAIQPILLPMRRYCARAFCPHLAHPVVVWLQSGPRHGVALLAERSFQDGQGAHDTENNHLAQVLAGFCVWGRAVLIGYIPKEATGLRYDSLAHVTCLEAMQMIYNERGVYNTLLYKNMLVAAEEKSGRFCRMCGLPFESNQDDCCTCIQWRLSPPPDEDAALQLPQEQETHDTNDDEDDIVRDGILPSRGRRRLSGHHVAVLALVTEKRPATA